MVSVVYLIHSRIFLKIQAALHSSVHQDFVLLLPNCSHLWSVVQIKNWSSYPILQWIEQDPSYPHPRACNWVSQPTRQPIWWSCLAGLQSQRWTLMWMKSKRSLTILPNRITGRSSAYFSWASSRKWDGQMLLTLIISLTHTWRTQHWKNNPGQFRGNNNIVKNKQFKLSLRTSRSLR